jgi:DNA recombination protein RmuC
MTAWLPLVAGLVLGALAAWMATRSTAGELRQQVRNLQAALQGKEQEAGNLQQEIRKESGEKIKAQTELDQVRMRLEEERRHFQETEKNLANTFDALAAKALQSNNQAFLDLASAAFALSKREIDGLVRPLADSLGRYESQIQAMEKSRQGAFGSLERQLSDLQAVTGNLNIALRGSHTQVRGRWGELTLHRAAELAGMSEHCDFSEQETMPAEAGRQRPDMIVNMPGGRRIPVDSKVPLEAFLKAASATTEEERKSQLAQHSGLVRAHMERLARQRYPDLFPSAPEIVLMFLPGESFLAAALEQDSRLLEDALQKRVMLATPTVLIALLLAVHHGWQQQALAENALEIKDLGRVLCERIRTASGYLAEVGSALGKAVDCYNSAIGSLESRFFPAARKFKDLAVPTGEEIVVLQPVEERPRPLISPEWGNSSEPGELDQTSDDPKLGKRASGL